MRLPDIANRLRELADSIPYPELNDLADQIGRRAIGTRAPVTSVKMTDEIRDEIHRIHKENPKLSQHEIARRVGVNPGRVSETLHGKRT